MVSHVSIRSIGMETGLFLWKLWFPFLIFPTLIRERYHSKEQLQMKERTQKRHPNPRGPLGGMGMGQGDAATFMKIGAERDLEI